MHSYLKSIGFGSLKTEEELENILDEVFRKYTDRQAVKALRNGNFRMLIKFLNIFNLLINIRQQNILKFSGR